MSADGKKDEKKKVLDEFFDAVDKKDVKKIKSVLDAKKVTIDDVDENGGTALHHCLRKTVDLDIVQTLLAHGADPNARAKGWFDSPPLHLLLREASAGPIDKVVDALLKAGADPLARDGFAQTPLDWTGDNTLDWAYDQVLRKAIVALLKEAAAKKRAAAS